MERIKGRLADIITALKADDSCLESIEIFLAYVTSASFQVSDTLLERIEVFLAHVTSASFQVSDSLLDRTEVFLTYIAIATIFKGFHTLMERIKGC